MTELNFPASPQAGDTYDYDSKRYFYDGIKWTTIKFVGDTALSIMDKHKAGTKEHGVDAIDWKGSIGFRNLLINGDFRVNQYNKMPFATSGSYIYAIDRWLIKSTGTSVTCTIAGGTGDINAPARNSLRIAGAAGNTSIQLTQRIESKNVWFSAGDLLMLSLLTSTAKQLSLSIYSMNAEDVSSAATLVSNQIVTPTALVAGWYFAEFKTPVAVTSACRNGIIVVIETTEGVGNGEIVHITNIQLEHGSVSTPFEHRSYGHELALCQRYCVAVHSPTVASETIGIGGYTTGSAAIAQYFLPVTMRAVPTWVGGGVLSIASQAGVTPVFSIDMRGSSLTLYASQTNTAGQSCYTVSSGVNTGFRGFDAEL